MRLRVVMTSASTPIERRRKAWTVSTKNGDTPTSTGTTRVGRPMAHADATSAVPPATAVRDLVGFTNSETSTVAECPPRAVLVRLIPHDDRREFCAHQGSQPKRARPGADPPRT